MSDYIAIIADVKGSQLMKDRALRQRQLISNLNQINVKYQDELAAQFVVSQGDSFQGLLSRPHKLSEILMALDLENKGIELRYGIGIGSLSTPIVYDNSNEMDGPAYHVARRMIDQVKEQESSYQHYQSNYQIGDDLASNYDLENSCLSMISIIQASWTNKQIEVIKAYQDHDKVQLKAAQALKRDVSTVSRSLQRSHYFTVIQAWKAVGESIVRRMEERK